MKTTIIALVLAQAISILAAGKCCTRQARNDIPTCQANGYWASCCSSWTDANHGHGCEHNTEFPIGRQVSGPAYDMPNGESINCAASGIWSCYWDIN